MPRLSRNRRGLALPFTIFLVTLVTIMLAMAFSRTAVEVQLSDTSDATTTALAVANGGLAAFFAEPFLNRPVPGDSFRYNVVGGYAWVVPEEFQRPADTIGEDIMYAVRATGYVIEPTLGANPQAQWTVVQMARWYYPPPMPSVPALLTAANGVNPGGAGGGQFTVMAANQCVGSLLPDQAKMLTTPPAASMDTSSGLPEWTHTSVDSINSFSGVDWATIASGNFTPDHQSIQPNDTSYSIQMVTGDATLTMPNNGTGILIVTGDLYLTGGGSPANDITWNGVIIVGGRVISNAAYFDLNGVMVTGLNESLPPFTPVLPNDMGSNGNDTDLLYDPCEVAKATSRMRGFVAVDNSWIDNWATY